MVWPATVAIGCCVNGFSSPDGECMLFVIALVGTGVLRRVVEVMELPTDGPEPFSVLLISVGEGAPGWIGTRNGATDIREPLPNGRLVGPPFSTMTGEGL
jgi:hypothetical protein